jgi:hypothetical protein
MLRRKAARDHADQQSKKTNVQIEEGSGIVFADLRLDSANELFALARISLFTSTNSFRLA